MAEEGRPATGFGHYLRDLMYGASDGLVTTLAIVSGVEGAALPVHVALILGLANLLGDGVSMGASNYLGLRSELEQNHIPLAEEKPTRHGLATVAAFIVAGAVPLLGLAAPAGWRMPAVLMLTFAMLAFTGLVRARFVHRPRWRSVLEMLSVAGVAAGLAYGIGVAGHAIVG